MGIIAIPLLLYVATASDVLHKAYEQEVSTRILDQNGDLLQILPNSKGQYMIPGAGSSRVRELVVQKEDKYFFYHLGINPVSIFRSIYRSFVYGERGGGSTITQQLVKNLLHHENERTIKNKIIETLYAIAIELNTPKEDILTMYVSTAYVGDQIEGLEMGAEHYFGKGTSDLTDGEIVRLLALLSAPSFQPSSAGNTARAMNLGKRLGVYNIPEYIGVPRDRLDAKKDAAIFELRTLISTSTSACASSLCIVNVDLKLTALIREIVRDTLGTKQFDSVTNAAVAVIKLGKDSEPNTLLALVGSPNPYGGNNGNQINMALEPRPIGSTWKPFIYGTAIEKGARPYSIIDDTEYRYEIGTGFAFYPKNYDGIYRGNVTLHYAISNSLNVPAVRALQFDDIHDFGIFLNDGLGFKTLQSYDSYQLSVALGGLEMNPLLLANYFTIFPRHGILAPLELQAEHALDIPMSIPVMEPRRIFRATTTELMTKMLSDRLLGVEQFGLTSNLNLPFSSYAVKTGTSYDYHDSWTVGYTPDAVVVVWIGNSNNSPMDFLTGSRGAGKIWHDVMTLLVARGDIIPQSFEERYLVPIETPEGRSFGLADDDVEFSRLIMKDKQIILEPHDRDIIQFTHGMSIPFRATAKLSYDLNGKALGTGLKVYWTPEGPGDYVIRATNESGKIISVIHLSIVE
ncbi:MAG: hypothetical protein A2Z88_04900 [Omnitrophica WOR_2 bacterium GWA2_47_8]|nr:MAG: hypothetical protein A2Z88_04900 [Omnitrophica WOR_2 bacterium GWA2_47_8]